MHLWTVVLSGLIAATGCAQTGPTPPAAEMTASTLTSVIAAARADAALRFGLAPESLKVVDAQAVTWSDGSLGCPQPGRQYTMALVPGFRVRLRGPSGVLDYHAGPRGGLLLCPAERAVEPSRSNGIL